jgi:hypothetical protein
MSYMTSAMISFVALLSAAKVSTLSAVDPSDVPRRKMPPGFGAAVLPVAGLDDVVLLVLPTLPPQPAMAKPPAPTAAAPSRSRRLISKSSSDTVSPLAATIRATRPACASAKTRFAPRGGKLETARSPAPGLADPRADSYDLLFSVVASNLANTTDTVRVVFPPIASPYGARDARGR